MQELRLVAVSEDGSYLVLATAGRGTRFTLPVDDRLRAAVRGHFSRLGQFEIEVESPLRPKEIQARIRAGETAEEIAETAGIPVERVRWFEGPVLQEREYMAQQAQRVAVRRPGEASPGPTLGEIVGDRLGRQGVDLEEIEWDSWKCENSTWRVRLSFFWDGRPYAAEWMFDPRRRHVSALDEEAARLSSLEIDGSVADTVTPLLPRRPAMKIVPDGRNDLSTPPRVPWPPAPTTREPGYGEPPRYAASETAAEPASPVEPSVARPTESSPERAAGQSAGQVAERSGDDLEEILAVTQGRPSVSPPKPATPDDEAAPMPASGRETAAETRPEHIPKQHTSQRSNQRPRRGPERPTQAEPAAQPDEPVVGHAEREDAPIDEAPAKEGTKEGTKEAAGEVAEEIPEEVTEQHVAAMANGGAVPSAAKPPATQSARNRRKGSARGKRASVPSWDEIMFGARRPE